MDGSAPAVQLKTPSRDGAPRAELLDRRSHRQFLQEPVPLSALDDLLGCLRAVELEGYPFGKYCYPSAGGLYPVQTYIYVKPDRVAGLAGGTYYHHPREHRLILLSPDARIGPGDHHPVNQPAFESSAFSIFLIAQLEAIAPIYGPVSREFCTLEAGYMGQLLMSASAGLELGLCPIGGLTPST